MRKQSVMKVFFFIEKLFDYLKPLETNVFFGATVFCPTHEKEEPFGLVSYCCCLSDDGGHRRTSRFVREETPELVYF